MDSFTLKIPRPLRFLLILVFSLVAAYLLWRIFFYQPLIVPSKFLEANREGATIAEKIVGLSKESAERISAISKLDKENKTSEALDLVYGELERNKEMRDGAIKLSQELGAMTESLSGIKPDSVRTRALQAINSETSLMSRLIDYNDYLDQLLVTLKDKFLYNIAPPRTKIDDLIAKINDETRSINELNNNFNDEIQNLFQN